MPRSIRDILPARRDFSPSLSHLTRGDGRSRAQWRAVLGQVDLEIPPAGTTERRSLSSLVLLE